MLVKSMEMVFLRVTALGSLDTDMASIPDQVPERSFGQKLASVQGWALLPLGGSLTLLHSEKLFSLKGLKE